MTSIGKENRNSQCLSYKKTVRDKEKEKKKKKGKKGRRKEEKKGGGGGGRALSQAVGRTGRSFMGV